MMKKMVKLFVGVCLLFTQAQAQNINVSGNISVNTTWDATSIDTVKVIGNIDVDTLITLIIEPGIVVDFTGDYYLNVIGVLDAQGTITDSITFTTSDTTGFYNNTHIGWAGIRIHDRRYSGDTTRLNFCIVEYGKADGSSTLPNSTHGGGLYTYSSWKIKLTNSSFRNNYALGDGGAYWDYYSFVNNGNQQDVANCSFTNNICEGSSGGGAIFTARSYNLNLINVKFIGNQSINGRGGAISNGPYNGYNSYIDIDLSRFSYNRSENNSGGAVSLIQNSEHNISRNIFNNNFAINGGALFINQTTASLQNNILVNNEASSSGGAIYFFNVFSDGGGTTAIANNTVAHNKALNGGGVYVYDGFGGGSVSQGPNLYLNKDIFYNNETTTASMNEDIGMGTAAGNNHTRFYSCSFTSDLNNTGVSIFTLVDDGNLNNTDPLFVTPSAGVGLLFDGYIGTDWSLDCLSPCIDKTGTVLYIPESLDYRSTPRMINNAIDIGAFEAYNFLTQPQHLTICEGDTAVFSSDYFYPGIDLMNSYWHISPDGGANWFAAENYSGNFVVSTNTNASSDGLLVTLNHDFGCGPVFSDTALLTVYPKEFTQNIVESCDTYFVEGANQTSSGIYYDTVQTAFGCEHVIETVLTINSSHFFSSTINICQGDSALILGTYEKVANLYYDSLSTISNCDSVYHVLLIVNPIYFINQAQTICSNDSLFVEGAWQNVPGIYYDTLQTVNSNCDSIIETVLTINPVSTVSVDTSFCSGSSIIFGGMTYNQGGVFEQTFTSFLNCDSIITYNITEHQLPNANIGSDTLWVCDGEELAFGLDDTAGISSYSISNFFTTAFNDSLTFIYDMMSPPSSVVSQVTDTNGCVSNDQVILSSANIQYLAIGLATLNDPTVDFTIANMPSSVDFWYWSFGDGDTLSGNTTPSHEYATNGSYEACLVGINGCGSDSSCVTFSIATVGIKEGGTPIEFNIYPNPVENQLRIESREILINKVVVIDVAGKIVKSEIENTNTIDVSDLPGGMYLLQIQTEKEVGYKRFIKE